MDVLTIARAPLRSATVSDVALMIKDRVFVERKEKGATFKMLDTLITTDKVVLSEEARKHFSGLTAKD